MSLSHIELAPDVSINLQRKATETGQSVDELANALLRERLAATVQTHADHRSLARAVLSTAGLLTELGPEAKKRAAQASLSIDEIHAIFTRVGGESLSSIVDAQRGSKE